MGVFGAASLLVVDRGKFAAESVFTSVALERKHLRLSVNGVDLLLTNHGENGIGNELDQHRPD